MSEKIQAYIVLGCMVLCAIYLIAYWRPNRYWQKHKKELEEGGRGYAD